MNDLYKLKLGDRMWIDRASKDVLKVPGGWIFSDWNGETDTPYNPVFVPFDNEFQSPTPPEPEGEKKTCGKRMKYGIPGDAFCKKCGCRNDEHEI